VPQQILVHRNELFLFSFIVPFQSSQTRWTSQKYLCLRWTQGCVGHGYQY